MDELTHSVTVTVNGKYTHGEKQHASVTISGDGGLDHMLEAFRAALVAAGFSVGTAAELGCEAREESAAERERCAIAGGAAVDAGLDGAGVAAAIRGA